MQVAPLPPNEAARLKNLLSYNILDSVEEKEFDELARLIAQVCNCQYGFINFLDKERQWFKAKYHFNLKESPRNTSFCSYTILKDDVMVVKDAKKDKRFYDNPFVTEGYKISFYAAAPITSAAGYKIGTVGAMDKNPKAIFGTEQKNTLKIIAHQVTALMELAAKNKLLIQQSEAMVAEEKKIVELTLTGQDEEKKFIANELQENFAQTLAATNLYLDSAEHTKGSNTDLIKKGKTNILKIIKDLKALSKSMLPSTFENTNYLGFIQEMLNDYGRQHNKKILFRHEGRLDCYDSKIGLTLFRIIQYQLKNASICVAKKIAIRIRTGKNIRMECVDDGKNATTSEPESMMLLHHIETRASILKGTVRMAANKNGQNLLVIEIPLLEDQQ